jgi:hypothetical protein
MATSIENRNQNKFPMNVWMLIVQMCVSCAKVHLHDVLHCCVGEKVKWLNAEIYNSMVMNKTHKNHVNHVQERHQTISKKDGEKSIWYDWVLPHLSDLLIHTIKYGTVTRQPERETTRKILCYCFELDLQCWVGKGTTEDGKPYDQSDGATISRVGMYISSDYIAIPLTHFPVKIEY